MKICAAILALGVVLGAQTAAAEVDRVVALVVSVGDGSERADAMQTQLQLMGAETLRADGPNNAELRSILTRFAREAATARASFVYLDVPAVIFEGRPFILPDAATLRRPTDLFTQAIPIQAFSRSAAQAEQGGAVAITVVTPDRGKLLDGLSVVTRAPAPIAGASSVLVGGIGTFGPVLQSLEETAKSEDVEVGEMLRRMSALEGVTVSDLPRNRIFLRESPKEPVETLAPAPVPASEEKADQTGSVSPLPQTAAVATPAESQEELELLEQALSRAAKRAIQRKLRALDHYQGLVDGIFGPQTREAIKAFQQDRSEQQTGVLSRRQLLDLSS